MRFSIHRPMNTRSHRYLDGDLAENALTPDERAWADAMRGMLEQAVTHVRAEPVPDLAARVMAALPAEAPRRHPWRVAMDWLWRPRPVRLTLRPAYALAGGAFAVAAAAVVLPSLDESVSPPAAVQQVVAPGGEGAPVVYVQFRLQTQASQVALAGSFTGWQPTLELQQTTPGVWTALVPLQPGVHDYVFVVNGTEWVPDPTAPQQVDDSFGGTNSRISLPPLGASA